MQDRECNTCGVKLNGYNSYRSVRTRCKECTKTAVRANRSAKLEQYREYDRNRYHSSDERKANAKACTDRARADGRHTEYVKKHREKHPEKYKARTAVGNALRDGKLTKLPCANCGASKVQAHHDDYSKPLDVVWLCSGCHGAHHAEKGDLRAPLEFSA